MLARNILTDVYCSVIFGFGSKEEKFETFVCRMKKEVLTWVLEMSVTFLCGTLGKTSDVTHQHILQVVHLRHALLLVNFMIKLQS